MRIMQITANLRGSVGRIVTDIHKDLLSRGVDSEIAWGRGAECESKDSFRFADPLDVMVDGVRSRIFDSAGLNSKRATKRLIAEIDRFRPSVVHLHCLHGYCINYPMLLGYLKDSGVPVVWTHHDAWAMTGHCAYFESARCQKWQTCCDRCPQTITYPRSLFYDGSKRNWLEKNDSYSGFERLALVSPSEWLAEVIRKSMLNPYSTRVIRNGIDTNLFRPRSSNIKAALGASNKKLLLGVSNTWEERKGLDDFLVLRDRLSDQYAICLVGPISSSSIRESGIIHVERTDSQEELAELYSAADLFINATYDDNYPTTNIESIACGTPVLSYPTGGSVESASMCGMITEDCSPDALVAAIETLDFDAWISDALAFDKTTLSSRLMCDKYYQLYCEVSNA